MADVVCLTLDEALIALDAVMVLYKAVEANPPNDGSNLLEIEALQHKIEAALERVPCS